jgi:hypothetical protein
MLLYLWIRDCAGVYDFIFYMPVRAIDGEPFDLL